MEFVSKEHEKFYNENKSISEKGRTYEALVYTIGINGDCREFFPSIYDKKTRLINSEVIFQPWQTTGSQNITRLAIHLFTGNIAENDDPEEYLPIRIFYGLDNTHRLGVLLALMYFG